MDLLKKVELKLPSYENWDRFRAISEKNDNNSEITRLDLHVFCLILQKDERDAWGHAPIHYQVLYGLD